MTHPLSIAGRGYGPRTTTPAAPRPAPGAPHAIVLDLRQSTAAALITAEFIDELLAARASTSTVRQQTVLLRRCMQRVLRLLDDVAPLGRTPARDHELRYVRIDPGVLLQQAALHATAGAWPRRVSVRATPVVALPAVRADAGRVLQTLASLCANAIRFTPTGGQVRLDAVAQEGAVQLSVSHGGRGLGDPSLAAMIERYWRVAPDEPPAVLSPGLAVARWNVALHGGAASVAEPPEGGLCVSFTLPLSDT